MQEREEKTLHIQREARYANYCDIGHTATEFVLDFGQFYAPEKDQAQMHTRIVIIPSSAKAILEILKSNIEKFEHSFGQIGREDL